MAGYKQKTAERIVASSPLTPLLERHASGPFGLTSLSVECLESLARAADTGFEGRHLVESLIIQELGKERPEGSLDVVELQPAHQLLIGAFQLVVTVDALCAWSATVVPPPQIEGALQLDGLEDLLRDPDEKLLTRLCDITAGFVKATAQKNPQAVADPTQVIKSITAGLLLLKNSVLRLAQGGTTASLEGALRRHVITIGPLRYRGLSSVVETSLPNHGLLDIRVDDIVGNSEYLEAAQRLARDVAGFDRETGKNPKKLNPILFALGRPGCGKTVTAHAIGHYFLEYCKEREIPAKFLVIRRSDWASSYQNASASNLIRLFEDEVKSFDGVCGIYWPDIDTALASRDSGQLRTEEKQNLGAVFGVFDGTILPKDGSWFMMCDANTMHMDEAAVSRIAQNPMTVSGATTPHDYARMMRDVCLRDVKSFLPSEEAAWTQLGELCVRHDLSGRNVEAICGNVRAIIQDFEYPPEYFRAKSDERKNIVLSLSKPISLEDFTKEIEDFARFSLEASRLDEEKAFRQEVETMVRQLNASRAAATALSTPGDS